MNLDISKLEHVRKHGKKTTSRCPACAEAGHDQTRNHLIIRADGRFGCVVYPGDSRDARRHRKRIFALCGNREVKPLTVRCDGLGRLGRVDESHYATAPIKTGLLGRLGRLFQTHLGTEQRHHQQAGRATEKLNDCERGVPGVPIAPVIEPHRPLSQRERVLLLRWCGTDSDPTIFEAIKLFNATIVGTERTIQRIVASHDFDDRHGAKDRGYADVLKLRPPSS